MKHFTIDSDNNITIHDSRKAAKEAGGDYFSDASQLEALLTPAKCGGERLLEIWNSLPGVTPVKKFTSRKIAAERIWRAIQSLGGTVTAKPQSQPDTGTQFAEPEVAATVGVQVADVAPAETESTKQANPKKGTREGSKTAQVLGLVRQSGGATLKELMAATGWQAHSVRGFISGQLTKKMCIKVASIKREDGERLYMAQ